MQILFLTQYFPPETGAAQNRLSDLTHRLAESGHCVTVLTALPNYPKGEIYEGFRGRLGITEDDNGIRVVRTWVYTTMKKSFLPRILNYLSFSILSCFAGLLAVNSADVVFVESPPLFLGISGYLLSKLKRAKFVLNISDLWPESAVVLGMLRNPRLIRWATRVEEGLYRRACFVTAQTQGIMASIRRRCPETPVVLLTNGVGPEFLARVEESRKHREAMRAELGVTGKFIVGYAGLHGLVYGLDAVLDVCRILGDFDEITFFLVGDGPEKPRLQERAQQDRLRNISFYPSQPAVRMPQILSAMDVVLITLKRHALFKGTLPSKLFEAMGAGIPVVAAMEGEAQAVIEKSDCGICVEPENVAAIAEAVLRLYRDPTLRKRLGENGREYVARHYNRKEIAEKFNRLLLDLGSPSGASFGKNCPVLTENGLRKHSSKTTGTSNWKAGN